MSEQKKTSNALKFLFGGLSGMGATFFVQPLDLIKTRMQVSAGEYKSSLDVVKAIIQKEGPLKLYTGLGAGLLRQATYTTGRLGVYTYLNDTYRRNNPTTPSFLVALGMGATAGACGSFIGTPAEVALIRMTADGRLPPAERRNYTNVVNALTRIIREEGVLALWRGCIPTMGRAIIVNMAQLVSYSQAKGYLLKTVEMKEGIGLHFTASMISGLITTIASMPVDIAKTRIQNMKSISGKPEYSGAIDVIVKVIKNEGLFKLWKGFVPYYCRLGPHTVLTFIFLEQINSFYSRYFLGQSGGSSGM